MKEMISYGRLRCRELSPHKNRGMEITYIEKGMLEWMAEGSCEKVEAGCIYFTLPWQVHGSMHPQEPDNQIWHILFQLAEDYPEPRSHFQFPDRFGFSQREMRVLSTALASSRRHCFPATPLMRTLMSALIDELQSTHALRDVHARTLTRALLVELKRIVSGEVTRPEHSSYSEQQVQSLLPLLAERCDQRWTLNEMAETCGIQRTQLNKLFQKLTGSTPMEYLGRIRIERAKTLLRETDTAIIDIALECGYATSQYFANVFRKATGATPSVYRRRFSGRNAIEEWQHIPFRSEEEERKRIEAFSE